jgi:HSP20 family protein
MPDVKGMAGPKGDGPQAEAKAGAGMPPRDERKADRLARRASLAAATAASPFAFIRRFAEELDRLVDDFGVEHEVHMPRLFSRGHEMLRRGAGLVEAEWSPRVDVVEREGKLIIRAELPGLTKDDIKVDVTGDAIAIEGERKHEAKEERGGYSYRECSYGRFFRSIPLPEGADASEAAAEFRNGMLEVTIPTPRRPAPSSRRIEVREGK